MTLSKSVDVKCHKSVFLLAVLVCLIFLQFLVPFHQQSHVVHIALHVILSLMAAFLLDIAQQYNPLPESAPHLLFCHPVL